MLTQTGGADVGRNGSVKAYAHQLTLDQHTAVATTLVQVHSDVAQIVDTLRANYGRADDKARAAAKLVTAVNGLRSLLSRAALVELYAEDPPVVQALYYPEPTT
jgi:hypothetical protein